MIDLYKLVVYHEIVLLQSKYGLKTILYQREDTLVMLGTWRCDIWFTKYYVRKGKFYKILIS